MTICDSPLFFQTPNSELSITRPSGFKKVNHVGILHFFKQFRVLIPFKTEVELFSNSYLLDGHSISVLTR